MPNVNVPVPPLSAVATELPVVDGATIAAIGGGSVAALAAVLSLTDPERRRRLQAEEVGGGDKDVVKEYFNNSGFQRWKKIYGETDDVNRVQRDIRLGHSKTVENVMAMLKDEGPLTGVTVCDAGCGTGSLSIPLAKEGAIVFASDISAAMVAEAQNKVRHIASPTSFLLLMFAFHMTSRCQSLFPLHLHELVISEHDFGVGFRGRKGTQLCKCFG